MYTFYIISGENGAEYIGKYIKEHTLGSKDIEQSFKDNLLFTNIFCFQQLGTVLRAVIQQ
jgi:hypothetical protein